MVDDIHAPCPICAKPIIRRKRETRLRWLRRRACGVPCADKMRNKTRGVDADPAPRHCAICEGEYTIRSNEERSNFRKRQTCGSEDCYSELMARKCGGRTHDVNRADWYRETWPVDYAGGFGRGDVDPDERGVVPLRPATHVATEANT